MSGQALIMPTPQAMYRIACIGWHGYRDKQDSATVPGHCDFYLSNNPA